MKTLSLDGQFTLDNTNFIPLNIHATELDGQVVGIFVMAGTLPDGTVLNTGTVYLKTFTMIKTDSGHAAQLTTKPFHFGKVTNAVATVRLTTENTVALSIVDKERHVLFSVPATSNTPVLLTTGRVSMHDYGN